MPASPHPTPAAQTARELFACALETPGGLKVQTIHALCTRLLQQFPFEANVPARFTVLDERDQNEMMERANLKVLLDASPRPDSATGGRSTMAMASAADVTFKEVVREACLSRDHFMAWTDARRRRRAAARNCRRRWASRPATASKMSSARSSTGRICRDRAGKIALVLDTGSQDRSDQASGCARRWLFPARRRWTNISACSSPSERTPRKTVLTKKFCDNNPALATLFEREAQRLGPLIERRRAVTIRDRTQALLHHRDRGWPRTTGAKSGSVACSTTTI